MLSNLFAVSKFYKIKSGKVIKKNYKAQFLNTVSFTKHLFAYFYEKKVPSIHTRIVYDIILTNSPPGESQEVYC